MSDPRILNTLTKFPTFLEYIANEPSYQINKVQAKLDYKIDRDMFIQKIGQAFHPAHN